ncbi:Pol protein, partial [Trichuris trichiura]
RDVDPVTSTNQDIRHRYNVGDDVWIRPPAGRCDTRYEEGTVTNVLSDQAVEVDGIPRHVRDIRRRTPSPDRQKGTNKTEDEVEEPLLIRMPIRDSNVNAESPAPQLRRSKRIRQQRGVSEEAKFTNKAPRPCVGYLVVEKQVGPVVFEDILYGAVALVALADGNLREPV